VTPARGERDWAAGSPRLAHHHRVRWLAPVLFVACAHASGASQPRRAEPEVQLPEPAITGTGPLFVDHFALALDARPGFGQLRVTITDTDQEPGIGATVVATSPALAGELVQITDEHGVTWFDAVPPGEYQIVYYYVDQTFVHEHVVVRAGIVTRERVRELPGGGGGPKHPLLCRSFGVC
jgi:hypothetical protein